MNPLLHSELINHNSADLARNASRHHDAARSPSAKRDRRNPLRGLAFLRVPRPA